ncbi:DNA glycosylase [Cryphonectria parasitica EP155]|uniref:DNA glycosylase n=1 Tax=Cryphonectria parasitica (strain ATCC 38755 / EP155) TaxID=660469 RepID=A0A9P4Y9G3_CRYP1|nr:DNA glycosylase [Cryphonectria parasitica EP155]KAF3768777.1 DNA glycosylase [Cryphonectria parasitica EP155]
MGKQANNTLKDFATEVPDGHVMLPHGLGIVKIAKGGATGTTRPVTTPDASTADAETRKPTQSQLRLNLSKPHSSLEEKEGDKNGHTEPTKDEINDLKKEHGRTKAVARKRIPVKNQTPYQQRTKVPWGESPWPEQAGPSAEDCESVYDILKEQHAGGKLNFERPAKIPPPSLEVAGCGETQLLIDGLCRTVLSGSTTMKHADKAIQNIVESYGTVTKSVVIDGEEVTPVKNCIDWNKVRLRGAAELKSVIRSGGLQEIGSKAVLDILETAYSVNSIRAAAFKREKADGVPADVPGADKLTQSQKDMEIWMFENDVISLEHLRVLSTEAAMNELVLLRGVGVKTAACVILFCLQEPCFAVDTHCFRMAQWLGWLPRDLREDVGREKAFAHLDQWIPDHLKYGLHQLFIEHGQKCQRCKASTREGNKDWEDCVCPLENLLDRNKPRPNPAKASRKRKAKEVKEEADIGDEAGSQNLGATETAEAILNPKLGGEVQVASEVLAGEEEQKPTRITRQRKKKVQYSEEYLESTTRKRQRGPRSGDSDEEYRPTRGGRKAKNGTV